MSSAEVFVVQHMLDEKGLRLNPLTAELSRSVSQSFALASQWHTSRTSLTVTPRRIPGKLVEVRTQERLASVYSPSQVHDNSPLPR